MNIEQVRIEWVQHHGPVDKAVTVGPACCGMRSGTGDRRRKCQQNHAYSTSVRHTYGDQDRFGYWVWHYHRPCELHDDPPPAGWDKIDPAQGYPARGDDLGNSGDSDYGDG